MTEKRHTCILPFEPSVPSAMAVLMSFARSVIPLWRFLDRPLLTRHIYSVARKDDNIQIVCTTQMSLYAYLYLCVQQTIKNTRGKTVNSVQSKWQDTMLRAKRGGGATDVLASFSERRNIRCKYAEMIVKVLKLCLHCKFFNVKISTNSAGS